MRFIHYLLIINIFTVLLPLRASEDSALQRPAISATSGILIDQKTGAVFFEKNADRLLYPASITKILTAIIGVETMEMDQQVTVSRKAAYSIEPGSSSIALKPNEIVKMKDVFYALMLRSANECGNIIAELSAGNNTGFASLMNTKALEIGCTHSTFKNPHGLHDAEHQVTARDMARIAAYAMKNNTFREIVQTRYYPFPDTNKHTHAERGNLRNKNKMLHPKSADYFPECTGIKGGFTRKALHTFVASAQQDDREVIAVVLQAPAKASMYNDIRRLLAYGLEQYGNRTLIDKGHLIQELTVEGGDEPLQCKTLESIQALLPLTIDPTTLERRLTLSAPPLPIREGEVLGEIAFYHHNELLGKTPLIAANAVLKKLSWEYMKRYIISLPFLLGSAVLFCLAILLIPIGTEKKSPPLRFR